MQVTYRVVDVFAEHAFEGNGLCVVDGDPGGADVMQAIARAMNLSETTFVTVTGDRSYDVRIFTPGDELPFAGHPSLGTAWSLGPGTWTQRSSGGTVTIVATEDGAVMSQPDPVFTEVYPEDAAAAMAIPAASAPRAFVAEVAGIRHLLVPTDHPLERLRFDTPAVLAATKAVNATGLGAMRLVDAGTVHVRLVATAGTLAFEDPGTGSAAGPVGLLARRLWNTGREMRIRQGDEIGRPCRIDVDAEPGAVRVGGRVREFARGAISL